MKAYFLKFLDHRIPFKERLFYMISSLVAGAGVLFLLVGPFLRMPISSLALYAVVAGLSALSFYLETKYHKTLLLSLFLIVFSLTAIYIAMIFIVNYVSVEMPLFLILILTISIVLLNGKIRIFVITIQYVFDMLVSYYTFVVKNGNAIAEGFNSGYMYIRLEMSIVVTGFICGIIVAYRNKMLASNIADIRKMSEKTEKTSYAKDMFLVNVSHEILTPLNAIIGVSDLILDSDNDDKVKEMVQNISNSSHALLSITTDLLDFSRINGEEIKVAKTKYDVSMILADIINLMSVRILDWKLDFYVNIDPNLPKVLVGDGGKLRQIIINLLSNAIKYTDEGRMTLNVSFEYLEGHDVRLFVSVEDTGRGIKPENVETIFEPYRRLGNDDDKLVEGNGLGLALCRTLVNAMGGSLNVESEYGKGSKFYFDIIQSLATDDVEPVAKLDRPDIKIASYIKSEAEKESLIKTCESLNIEHTVLDNPEEMDKLFRYEYFDYYVLDSMAIDEIKNIHRGKPIDSKKIISVCGSNASVAIDSPGAILQKPIYCMNLCESINKKKKNVVHNVSYDESLKLNGLKILVVDDNIVNITVAAGLLERYSPEIATASSGKEAIRYMNANHADLIFLDYMMPDMDGIDTLHEIRKLSNKTAKSVPIIALTANVVSGAKEMFLEAGFTDYLPKPIETEALEEMLKKYLLK